MDFKFSKYIVGFFVKRPGLVPVRAYEFKIKCKHDIVCFSMSLLSIHPFSVPANPQSQVSAKAFPNCQGARGGHVTIIVKIMSQNLFSLALSYFPGTVPRQYFFKGYTFVSSVIDFESRKATSISKDFVIKKKNNKKQHSLIFLPTYLIFCIFMCFVFIGVFTSHYPT